MRGLDVVPVRAISPVSVADDTAQVGEWVDMTNYQALEFVLAIGAIADADATFAALVEHADADDKSDAQAVPDEFLIGTEALASFQFDSDNSTRKIGYKGLKRWVRLTITPSGNSGGALLAAIAVLGFPLHDSP